MAQKKTVLVADDDHKIRDTIRDILAINDYDAYCAADGAVALELLKRMCFDIVISDFFMPGLNGSELAREARHRYPGSFILGISGNNAREDFLKAGANAFLKKPFDPADLLSLIKRP